MTAARCEISGCSRPAAHAVSLDFGQQMGDSPVRADVPLNNVPVCDLHFLAMTGMERAAFIAWDIVDGGILGAVVCCPECPCVPGIGCDGSGLVHRPYRLPGGQHIDLHRDADLYMQVLDRAVVQEPSDDGQ